MANISDMIADFINQVIGDEEEIQLSRNELANYFAVAPSQINYVLATRFTLDRGYVIESKRGGGGFITLVRISEDKTSLLNSLLEEIKNAPGFNYNRAAQIVDRLEREGIVGGAEAELIKAAVSDRALNCPIKVSDNLRKSIFTEILICLMKKKGE